MAHNYDAILNARQYDTMVHAYRNANKFAINLDCKDSYRILDHIY